MPKNWGYYHVDCGHFPAQIKLCFSNETFQKILLDHGIAMKASALDEGIGSVALPETDTTAGLRIDAPAELAHALNEAASAPASSLAFAPLEPFIADATLPNNLAEHLDAGKVGCV